MRKLMLIIWLVVLAIIIAVLFWYNDWKYSQPTPIPEHYRPVTMNEHVELPAAIRQSGKKPVFIHFFNPACPCSRFNIPHVQSLIRQYGDAVDFAIVVMSKKKYTVKQIQEKFDAGIPVFFDPGVAVSCGVYSTPQAVIVDTAGRLFYRGNYNINRYCSNKETEFARIALSAFLQHNYTITFSQAALRAYGCQLPNCNR